MKDAISTCALQSSGEFRCHDLYNESNSQPQHLIKQFGFRANKHGQVHQDLLKRQRMVSNILRIGNRIGYNLDFLYASFYNHDNSKSISFFRLICATKTQNISVKRKCYWAFLIRSVSYM